MGFFKKFFKSEPKNEAKLEHIKDSNVSIYQNSTVYQTVESEKGITNKSELKEEDYGLYVDYIALPDTLITRYITGQNEKKGVYIASLLDYSQPKTIFDVLEEENKIVLLGNPGIGKTIELKRVAMEYWNNGSDEFVPIFRNLKNFTKQDTIDSYISLNYKSIESVCFVFDGIDEISDIQDFESKLQTFIKSLKNPNYKIIISCRANVFQSSVKKIDNFKIYYLNDLTLQEGLGILNKKTKFRNLSIRELGSNLKDFLKNPFLIGVVIDYINDNQSIPTNSAELWFSYVKKRLSVDSEEKQIKKGINATLIEFYSKKISLINELSRSNSFTDEKILRVTKNNSSDLDSFLLNPMLEKNINQNVWYFEHKNIQEYFASKILSDLEFDKILEFIQIKDIGKTHPALFNTITFLINILEDSDKFSKLIDWIIANEPELLFRADTNRVTEKIKVEVFQKYFTKKAIEETLWLTTNETIEIDKISRFADCSDNYDFLLNIIQDENVNQRARVSAITVLTYFEIPSNKKDSLKDLFWNYLVDEKCTKDFKSTILEFFYYSFSYNADQELIKQLVNLFINETHNRINVKLLNLLENYEDLNEFSDYIFEEFLRSHNLKEREDNSDNVGRGNSYKSLEFLLKISKPDIFSKLINAYLSNSHKAYLSNSDLEKIVEKVVDATRDDPNYILSFFNIDNKVAYHSHRNFLYKVIELTDSNNSVLLYLLEKVEFKEISFFVSKLVNESNINDVCAILVNEKDTKEVEYFRDNIGFYDRGLAVKFDEIMRQKGLKFKEKVFTKEDEIERDNQLRAERQVLIDTLFDRNKLIEEVKRFYQENKVDDINCKDFISLIYDTRRCEKQVYYDSFNASIEIIRSVLDCYDSEKMNCQQVIDEVKNDDFYIISKVKEKVGDFNSSNWDYVLSDNQKQTIIDWCFKTYSLIDFDNVLKVYENGSWSYVSNYYEKIKIILFFESQFNIDLPKEFWLNIIPFFKIEDYTEELDRFEILLNKINDKKLFEEKVIDNIANKSLTSTALYNHINYAIQNDLIEVFPKIKTYFLTSFLDRNGNLLRLFYEKTGDVELLKKCCDDLKEDRCWNSIVIMLEENIDNEFCYQKAKELFELDIDVTNSNFAFFKARALNVFFILNKIEAINIIVNSIREDKEIEFFDVSGYSNYSNIEDFKNIKEIFIHSQKKSEYVRRNDYYNFLVQYLENIVQNGSYDKLKIILEEIRDEYAQEQKELFQINFLLGKIENKYYGLNSKPFTFKEALKIVEELV